MVVGVTEIGENQVRAQSLKAAPWKKRSGPLTQMAKALQAAVDSGYGVKIEISPRADADCAVPTAFEEWKRKHAR